MLGIDDRKRFTIVLNRYDYLDDCTRGTMIAGGKVFQTLEPPRRSEKPRCIPADTYQIFFDYSKKFDAVLPELADVPDFTEIKIHKLNWGYETEGCIGVGKKGGKNYIEYSKDALDELIKILRDAETQGFSLWINIID